MQSHSLRFPPSTLLTYPNPLKPPPRPRPRPPTLPLPRILHPLRNILTPILDARPRIRQRIPDRFPRAARRTGDRLAYAARCGARDAPEGAREAADGVAQGRGGEFCGAR